MNKRQRKKQAKKQAIKKGAYKIMLDNEVIYNAK